MDPDPVEAGPDSAEAGLCQVRTGEGYSSHPGARAGQEEGGRAPGQALERQGGAQGQVPVHPQHDVPDPDPAGLGPGQGAGVWPQPKGNHMARKAGRKFGSASRLELNFQ